MLPPMMLTRQTLFPEPDLPDDVELRDQGCRLARDWRVGPSAFLAHHGVVSEIAYKQASMAQGRVMRHAQIGWRAAGKSIAAYHDIWATCAARGVAVDRYGLCLDWSMALPMASRAKAQRGTGMILRGPEDFVTLANAAPVAAHFGDFVLGFPGAVENTCFALAAGSTAIGNLGQYFTFRIPGHDDDIAATAATVTALHLIAAQPVPVLVHSNIDDGFAAQFTDVANALGMILVERDIVTRLIGAEIGHAYGHHFAEPLVRMGFLRALHRAGALPGTMVYGNTTSYRGTPVENWAGLGSYLLADVLGQIATPTGHAINPVPVTENQRIPDVDEVIEAHLFAERLVEQAQGWPALLDEAAVDAMAERLLAGAGRFRAQLWQGLAAAGVNTASAFEVLLALRRLGGRRIETAFGAGLPDARASGGRLPEVPATILSEIAHLTRAALAGQATDGLEGLRVLVATSDVHEHGKMLIDDMLRQLGAQALDGGVSTDAAALLALIDTTLPDAIAISTYNGVALGYFRALHAGLRARGLTIPVLIGGRLNQIPEGSNSSLPRDVGDDLAAEGAWVCREAADLVPALRRIAQKRAVPP
jgi:methylmalonyl-CoA mutase cobalamin-binding subunit